MKLLLAVASLLLSLSAQATDYMIQSLPYNGIQLLVGQHTDDFHFTASGLTTITVMPRTTEYIACSGRYCRSPGTYHASITSIRLLGDDGTAITMSPGTKQFTLNGPFTLEVAGVGYGVGTAAGEGHYDVRITKPVTSAAD